MAVRRRRPSLRVIIIGIVVAVILAFTFLSRFYTDFLWFKEVGLTSVLYKSLGTQFVLAIIGFAFIAVIIYINLLIAGRMASEYRLPRLEVIGREDQLQRFRENVQPYLRWIRIGIAVVLGLFAGLSFGAEWRDFLLWSNGGDFGITDPQFGKDVGFYVFDLPFYQAVLGRIFAALILTLIVTLIAHYLYGSIRPEAGWRGVQPGAMAHVSVLLGLIALVKAVQYWLGQYALNFSERGVVTGASYTDVNAQLPALKLLTIISIISAILFLVNIRVRTLRLPIAAVGIWILTAVLAGAVWPALVQRFSVDPQEAQREKPFIARNLEATREAFGLTDIESQEFEIGPDLTAQAVSDEEEVLRNVRLWDPFVLATAYQQLQALRPYYDFTDVDIDRYAINGEQRQVLLSPRELSIQGIPDPTWTNEHLQFTHGYGLVASLANETTAVGGPSFLVRDVESIPEEGAESLEFEQKGIYYGESYESTQYSVVNTGQDEIDFPTSEGVETTNYSGEGGVNVGGLLQQVAFAIREGDPNLVLSSLVQGESKILIYRNVRDRVLRAAPFLSLDHDPYSAIVDGRLVWILDAYTTSQWYPYGQRFDMAEVVGSDEPGALDGDINYLRNSVKVVVDAYDGTMDFYVVDDEDPMIQAWRSAFPDIFTDEEPSESLNEHFRYPEDQFDAQSEVYLTYHMEDPEAFYAKEDAWSIPGNPNPNEGEAAELPARYLLFQLPGEPSQEFVLTRPTTPRGKNNMIAFMVARADPDNYGELLSLEFSRQRTILGPTQVDNLVNQDVQFSQEKTLLERGGSTVQFGAQVILPLQESIVYIQPIFVTAENVGIPELKRVALVYKDAVVVEETFGDALAQLFGEVAGGPTEPTQPDQPQDGGQPEEPGGGGQPDEELQALIDQAGRVYADAQDALQAGDFEEYGRLIDRLGELLDEASQLSGAPVEPPGAGGGGTAGGPAGGGGGD
jgi:uncharacterized protein